MCPYCAEAIHVGECVPTVVREQPTLPPVSWEGWRITAIRRYVGRKRVGKKVIPFPRRSIVWRYYDQLDAG